MYMYQALTCLMTYLMASMHAHYGEATLVFAGDAMMHQSQIDAAHQRDGEYDFSEYFKAIQPFVKEADYAVVNLETPLGGKPYSGYPCFCAPDSYAKALIDAGFDCFLTANNHALDRSDRGVRRTIEVLDSMLMPHVGSYCDAAQRDTVLPIIQVIKGIKVGLLNYTYGTNGITARSGAVIDYIDKEQIKKDIKKTRDAGAELMCVCMHWGDEYKLLPNGHQKALADFLVDEGVDLVIGGHPHVIQPMEMRTRKDGRKSLVVYSLGNFISGMKTRDTKGGAMVKAYVSRNDYGIAQVDSAGYKLVFVERGTPGGRNFRLIDADSCANSPYRADCVAFRNEAEDIFNKHNVDVPKLK